MEQEEWKPVVGYEGLYEVSNLGRVKSINYRNTGKEGILKPAPNTWGYLQVGLCKNGEQETCKVHILVMRAFVGKCPAGYEVDHYDWNPENNRLENLSYQPKEVNRARRSPEWQKNQSEAMKKLAQDPEWLKKNAEAREKMYQDPEWQKNVREGAKKRAADPEWLKNTAEAAKKRAEDPEWRRKNAEANKRKAQDPQWKKNHAEAMQRLSENTEWLRKNAEKNRRIRSKPVNQFTLEGEYIKSWQSASDAARKLGCQQSAISECCSEKRKTTGGFIWKFAV